MQQGTLRQCELQQEELSKKLSLIRQIFAVSPPARGYKNGKPGEKESGSWNEKKKSEAEAEIKEMAAMCHC